MTDREDYEALLAAEHAERDARADQIHSDARALLAARAATLFSGTREIINPASITGLTTFSLSGVPAYPEATLLFINGVNLAYGTHFSVSGNTVTIVNGYTFDNETDLTDVIEVIWR